MPISVALQSKAWVCSRLIAGNAGLNPAEGKNVRVFHLVRVV